MRVGLRMHFVNCHMQDTMMVVDDVNPPHPQCPCCDMLVLWTALNFLHTNNAQCTKGEEWNQCRLVVEENRADTERSFRENGRPLTMVLTFNYLGRIIMASDNEWKLVVGNLCEAQNKWARISRILGREGEYTRVSGNFFKAVVQVVLLIGFYTLVMTPLMGQTWGGFQHRVAHRLAGKHPRWINDDGSEILSLGEEIQESGLEVVEDYITWRQNRFAQYIATRPILNICE